MDLFKKGFNVFLTILLTLSLFSPVTVNADELTDSSTVQVRIEGLNETIVPLTEVDVNASEIYSEYGSLLDSIDEDDSTVYAIHAIIKVLDQAGYDVENSSEFDFGGGMYISNIAGLETFSTGSQDGWMYTHNHVISNYGVSQQEIKDGDMIVMYFTTNWENNPYTFFEHPGYSSEINENITLNLQGAFKNEDWQDYHAPIENAELVINGEKSLYKTDTEGNVTLQFSEPGEYEITAVRGEGKYSNINRPFTKITVHPVNSEGTKTSSPVDNDDDQAIANVISLISSLPTIEEISETNQLAIQNARQAYEALNIEQKALVTNLEILVQKENAYNSLVRVHDVISQIDALPQVDMVNATHEESIVQATNEYEKLSDSEKIAVTNFVKLQELQNRLIELKKILITKITLTEKNISLPKVGDTASIKVTLKPTNATERVIWSSSDEKVVTVVDGVIRAIGKGKATITAASESGDVKVSTSIVVSPTIEEALLSSNAYLLSKTPTPKFGNEWNVFALARGGYEVPEGYFETYYNNVAAHLQDKEGVLSGNNTEYSRLIIALSAIGKDARDVGGYNLVENLADLDKVVRQGINGAIFALIALDTQNYEIPDIVTENRTTRNKLIEFILQKEISGGGFALSGTNPDPDMTGMVIQALAPYQSKQEVKEAIDRAVAKLATMQTENGGYKSWGSENVQSADQVLVALSTLGIDGLNDERFLKENGSSILTNILSYYTIDGGFAHPKNGLTNIMATQQTAYALAAYERLLNNQTPLYDMSDVPLTSPEDDDEDQDPNNPGGEGNTGNPSNPGNPGGDTGNPDNSEKIESASISIVISNTEKPLPVTQIDLVDGDTVIDVLTRATSKYNIALSTRNTEYGVYVEGINGLFEFDRGPLSGWMYRVNGVFPSYSAGYYTVKPGDKIEWLYTTDLGNDIGGNFEDGEDTPSTGTNPEDGKTESKESTISVENREGEIRAEISSKDLIEILKDKKSNVLVIKDNQGTKIEVPKSSLNIPNISDEKIILVAKMIESEGKQAFQVQFEIEKNDGTTQTIKTGKEYVKITAPVKDIPKDAVFLQFLDGQYKAIPHTMKDGQVTIRTKSSGLFVISTQNNSFKDISNTIYKEEIEYLSKRGVVAGHEDGTFAPNKSISRAHFAALIANALGLQPEEEGQFKDTDGQWYETHIQALYEAGITSGTSTTTFNPNANITRQQAAAMMARILEYVSKKAEQTSERSFKDSEQINKQFAESIAIVNSLGIMNGKEDGTFDPNGNLTRGQMAIILTRTLNITDMM